MMVAGMRDKETFSTVLGSKMHLTVTCPLDRPRQMSEITVLKGRNLLK